MKAATVTVEVTERELAYLQRVTGFPYGNFPHLTAKLGEASKAMRLAKRERNRALKLARFEKREQKINQGE